MKGDYSRPGVMPSRYLKEIDLPSQSDGKVTVVMNLRSATRTIIKKDSHASIKTEGLLGDKYIEISFGSTKGDAVQNGDTIASETPKDYVRTRPRAHGRSPGWRRRLP